MVAERYPKTVVIDTQRDGRKSSNTHPFATLQDAVSSTREWNELSFPPENLASPLGFPVVNPLNGLNVLHIASGCTHSPSLTHLLDLVPTEAPLSKLRLHTSLICQYTLAPSSLLPCSAKTHSTYCQRKRIHERFVLLATFTQLQRFEPNV